MTCAIKHPLLAAAPTAAFYWQKWNVIGWEKQYVDVNCTIKQTSYRLSYRCSSSLLPTVTIYPHHSGAWVQQYATSVFLHNRSKNTEAKRSPSLTHMIILRHPDVGMMGPKVKCQDPNHLKTFCLHNNQKLWSTSNIIVKPSPPSSSNSTLASVRYELISSANGPLWLSSSWYVPCSEMTPFVMTMISSTCDRKLIPCVTRILVCTHISKYQQTLAVC